LVAAWPVNYYPHHIGDYLRDTSHLTALEDGTYRRMLDVYYASEKPLPLETQWVCRLVRARTTEEQEAVEEILRQFFEKRPDGWHNKRADLEIRKSKVRIKAAKNNGKRGGRPITQRVSNANPAGLQPDNPDESSQNQNQNQNQRVEKRSRGSRLPPDWQPSEILKAWAVKDRPDLEIAVVVERFRDYWAAKPGKAGLKLDWEATFRNWVRDEKPGKKTAPIGEVI